MFSQGQIAIWSVIGIGLFNSIMWSNIFTLAIDKLKEFTNHGSSILVMMIVGGAILPVLQGVLSDIPAIGVKYCFYRAGGSLFVFGVLWTKGISAGMNFL